MLCNPISYYPDKIDEMVFFQDNNLETMEIINRYNHLIAKGKYSEASDYINQQKGIYGFFADFFNLMENRIYSLQKYLLNKPPKKQPFIYYDEKAYPPLDISVFSDTDEEESMETIQLFSDDGNSEDLSSYHLFPNDEEPEKEELEPPLTNQDTIWI